MGYTKEAIKGISWIGFFRIATRGISYLRIVILARILSPSQFGAADIVLIVLSITEIFTETGINIVLIQQKEKIDKYINTAWVVSILRGLLIALVILIFASSISQFFTSQLVYDLLIVSIFVPIFRGFINPSIAIFVKDMQFRKEFYYRTLIFFAEAAVSVLFVFILKSPVAIIYGLIFGALFEIIFSFLIAKPQPRFRFEGELFRQVIARGKWLTATGIFNYLYHNGDNIVVGKLLGTGALGLYQRAYSISMLPITEVSDTFGKVMLPVFVKMSDDIARLKRAYLRSLLLISAIVVPSGALIFMFPELVIKIILGSQWVDSAPALQILTLFGVIRAISISSLSPFYAVKRQEYVSQITFVSFLGLAITIIPFVNMWGLVGAAYSALFGTIISLPLIIYYLNKIFTIKVFKNQ
jgi:O-antigen/teichoic acid export membrane protein